MTDTKSELRETTPEIWKFALASEPLNRFAMPVGSKVLCAQMQDRVPTIWAACPQHSETSEERTFKIVGTGSGKVYSNDLYVGTVQDGPWVWHVFEVLP